MNGRKFFAITCFGIFISCNINTVYNDREQDKRDGEATLRIFYKSIHNKSYKNVYPFLSSQFLIKSDTNNLFELFDWSSKQLGIIDSLHLEHWETSVVEGSKPKSEYKFIFIAFRSKSPSKETITLVKENDTVKVLSYNIDSKGLHNALIQ